MSFAAVASVHTIRKRSQKCLAEKVVRFGSLGWIPMIQVPFNIVSSPVPTLEEKKGLVRILGAALSNFHAPMRSQLWLSHLTSLPQMQHHYTVCIAIQFR